MKPVHAALLLILFSSLSLAAQNIQSSTPNTDVPVTLIGTSDLHALATSPAATSQFNFRRIPELKKPVIPGARAAASTSSLVQTGLPVVKSTVFGFDALDSRDTGLLTGFVHEPSDMALGVSSSQIAEGVNDGLEVFSQTGTRVAGPVSFEAFFKVPPATATRELELSDPQIFFDWLTKRWFVTILQFPINPKTGAFLPGSQILLGVSKTSDAGGAYNLYSIDVSENQFPGCPCLGDQPLLGVNDDGVFLSVNEFASSTLRFVSALILALDKDALIAGSSTVTRKGFINQTQAEGPAFSVHPARPAPGTPASENDNIEYLVSSLDFTATVDNRLTLWVIRGTESLHGTGSSVTLQRSTFVSETYGQPPSAVQKPGPIPLGASVGEPEERLDTGDDRMQQVYFTNGKLVCAVTTVILSPTGRAPRAGIAWFQIQSTLGTSSVSGSIAKQGYIAAQGSRSVFYPSAAVARTGAGAIGMSLSGPDFFPSTAFVFFDNANAGVNIFELFAGVAPEDGFSGYRAFGFNGVARWGDYSAAVISPGGRVWTAAEYITPRQRTRFTNWGTAISRTR